MTVILLVLSVVTAAAAFAALRYALVFPLMPGRRSAAVLAGTHAPSDSDDLARRLRAHVTAIASVPHNIAHYPALEAAARHIETTLTGTGYRPQAQIYEADGVAVRNIEVVYAPADAGPDTPTYVIGAHYDSPDDSPGANDNATGVAATLELARLLQGMMPRTHRLRIVFWVNEELPYGKTPEMGSWRHAKQLADSGERVAGMIALETLGYFSDTPGSQQFPFPFGLVYPNCGNFIAFVGLPGSRAFTHRVTRAFRRGSDFPSIGGVAPGFIPGIDLSDHWAYHQFGYPALMVTDTAPFRNPYYHQPDDLPGTVDYQSLARVTVGLERVVRELVG
ncbi:MAG: M28 family peptidase [Hyphomicrobium sp.]